MAQLLSSRSANLVSFRLQMHVHDQQRFKSQPLPQRLPECLFRTPGERSGSIPRSMFSGTNLHVRVSTCCAQSLRGASNQVLELHSTSGASG
jgi:hypothetical protein